MDNNSLKIRQCIASENHVELIELLNSGIDPNFEGGWPIRFAARFGICEIVKTLIQHGANPHLLDESGASTLQLAVYSGQHWSSNKWMFLLSYCDSSQLADGAAVAIIFNNKAALDKILKTGRCNTNIPTTLTGKTVEDLAKGYNLQHLLNPATSTVTETVNTRMSFLSPTPVARQSRITTRDTLSPHYQQNRNLSPSVARFFNQTASQASLTPPRNLISSPIRNV